MQVNTGSNVGDVSAGIYGNRPISTGQYRQGLGDIEQKQKTNEESRDKELTSFSSTPPKPEPMPKVQDYQTPPMQKFGSVGMVIAAMGGLLTRHPMTTALNAGAKVMEAQNAANLQAYEQAMKEWEVSSKNALEQAKWQQSQEKIILDKYKGNDEELNTHMKLLEAQTKDPSLDYALKTQTIHARVAQTAVAIEKLQKAREDQLDHATIVKAAYQTWLDNHKKPDGSEYSLEEIPLQERAKIITQANAAAKGKGDTIDQLSDEDYEKLKNDPSMTTPLRAYMITGNARLALGGAAFGGSKTLQPRIEALQRMALEKDPDFNPAIAQITTQGYTRELNAVQTQNAKISLASNILDSSIPSLIASAKKLDLSASTNWNDLYNAARSRFNSADFKNFQTQLRAATTDYAQFLGRGRQTVHSDEEALRLLNESMNTASLEGFKDAVSTERTNVKKGIDDTLEDITDRISGKSASSDVNTTDLYDKYGLKKP